MGKRKREESARTSPHLTRDRSLPPFIGTRRQRAIQRQRRRAKATGNVVRVREALCYQSDRDRRPLRFHIEDGHVSYGAIRSWRRSTMEASLTAAMISAQRGTSASITVSGCNTSNISRGHLLAKSLGGTGKKSQNLVPLVQGSNLDHYDEIEEVVLFHVLKIQDRRDLKARRDLIRSLSSSERERQGYLHSVRYTVTPIYERDTDSVIPIRLECTAICSCGQRILPTRTIWNNAKRLKREN